MSKAQNFTSIRTAFQPLALTLAELGSAQLKLVFKYLRIDFGLNLSASTNMLSRFFYSLRKAKNQLVLEHFSIYRIDKNTFYFFFQRNLHAQKMYLWFSKDPPAIEHSPM